MILDPQYGLLAGTGDLFTTEGTTVIPSFLDEDGDLILDEDGIPENANFFFGPAGWERLFPWGSERGVRLHRWVDHCG